MAHTDLNYTYATTGGRSRVETVQVDLDRTLKGKLVETSDIQTFLNFRDVIVHYNGHRYRLEQLTKNGGFELQPDGWS